MLITILRIFNATMELIGISVIIPLIMIIVDTEHALGYSYIHKFYSLLGEPDFKTFHFLTFILSCVLVFFSMLISILTIYASGRFFKRLNAEISGRLIKAYLNLPLTEFYRKSYSEFCKDINTLGIMISHNVLSSLTIIIAKVWLVTIIIIVLSIKDLGVAAIVFSIIFSCYFLIYYFIKPEIRRLSEFNFEKHTLLSQYLRDGYANYRDFVLYQTSDELSHKYTDLRKDVTKRNALIELLGAFPRHLIENIAFLSVIIFAYWQGTVSGGSVMMNDLLLYVVAGYRILPSIQQIYHSMNGITAANSILQGKARELKLITKQKHAPAVIDLPLERLAIDGLSCRMDDGTCLFHNLSKEIKLSGLVQIFGDSGSGKSTLIEMLIGLRSAETGMIRYDGHVLDERIKQVVWENTAYCSQHSLIYEDTIRNNITHWDNSNTELLEFACQLVGLKPVLERLGGLDTAVGEQTMVLSGGERQRIILARAIYKNTRILILDEALSAIEHREMNRILSELREHYRDGCIILVTHRKDNIEVDQSIILQ